MLEDLTLEIADLPGHLLGLAIARTVKIDDDATGFGWLVDVSSWNDVEFASIGTANGDMRSWRRANRRPSRSV